MSSAPPPQFCANCGAALRPPGKFCSACGRAQLEDASAAMTGLLDSDYVLKQRYRIRGRLGQGGFGAVYQVEDALFKNAQRAVKEMSQSSLSPQELQEAITAFEQEAMMLAGLVHPYLPRIYDYFEENGRWYLVMDFIAGETLEARLERVPTGKLPMQEVLDIGIKLADVLGYLHTRQPPIIFRDLKPANVMLTPEDHLYIIDFGIARFFKPGQVKDTVPLGSVGYAAPEQYAKAHTQTSASADIYSLGALLHQVFSGHDPSQTPFQFLPLTPGLQGSALALAELVRRMVEREREKRPASMQEIKQALLRIRGQQITDSGVIVPAPAAPHPATSLPSPAGTPPEPQKTVEQWLGEGGALFQAGRNNEALVAFERALELDPSNATGWNNKSAVLLNLMRNSEALVAAEQALQLDPTYAAAWSNKGRALLAITRRSEALAAFEQALQLNPTFAVAWSNKSAALFELTRYNEALMAAERSLQLDPNAAGAWNTKSAVLRSLTRYNEAVVAAERSLQLDPNVTAAWNNKSVALFNLRRYSEALVAAEHVLQLNPNHVAGWNNKSSALVALTRYSEALVAAERSLQLDPTYAVAWFNKGQALTALGRKREAEQAYGTANMFGWKR